MSGPDRARAHDTEVDVCVVGGGPAGSVLATRLSQLGRRVCLVERRPFPRAQLGESLTPGVRPLLASIGAEWVLDADGADRVHTVVRRWGQSDDSRIDPRAEGRVVDRGRFDARLLSHAASLGVQVLQPATVRHHERSGTAGWTLTLDSPVRGALVIGARLLAFATGRGGSGAPRVPVSATLPRTMALHAYWSGPAVPTEPRIESVRDGWCWGVPIPGVGYNALVFVEADALRRGGRGALEELYARMLAQSALVRPAAGSVRLSPILACDATPSRATSCIAADLIRVGDAALALDPLSSSGVQKAIQNALSGAIVANTLLQHPERAAVAMASYERQVETTAGRHARWSAGHYASVAAGGDMGRFWVARSSDAMPDRATPVVDARLTPATPLTLSPLASICRTGCYGTEFVAERRALEHPSLESPVAFVGGHDVVALLEALPLAPTADALVQQWPLPVHEGRAVARWLVQHGILVAQAAPTGGVA